MVKSPPAIEVTRIQSQDQENLLEEVRATHSSILVWRIPWTEKPGGLQSLGLQRVRHDWVTNTCISIRTKKELSRFLIAAVAAKLLQRCPTLCDPIERSPPGSLIPGILQTRTLEWVVISFSNAWKRKVKVKLFSRVWLLATLWTAAYQAPPMGISRQEYWSGLPLPSPHTILISC